MSPFSRPASRTYANIASLTPTQQREESCGTLQTFEDHGHRRAWGLFAYPNDSYSVSAQTDVDEDAEIVRATIRCLARDGRCSSSLGSR